MRAKGVQDEQCRADRDRAVGEIERGPVVAEGVEIEEIHHVPERDPVPEVAERPAEDKRQAGAEQPVALVSPQQRDDDGRRGERQAA